MLLCLAGSAPGCSCLFHFLQASHIEFFRSPEVSRAHVFELLAQGRREEWICQPLSILLSTAMGNRTSSWASLTAPALPDCDPTPLDRGQAAPNTLPSLDTWDGPSRLSSE